MDLQRDEAFEEAYSKICKPIIARPYPRNEQGEYIYKEIHEAHLMWQAAKAVTDNSLFKLKNTIEAHYDKINDAMHEEGYNDKSFGQLMALDFVEEAVDEMIEAKEQSHAN